MKIHYDVQFDLFEETGEMENDFECSKTSLPISAIPELQKLQSDDGRPATLDMFCLGSRSVVFNRQYEANIGKTRTTSYLFKNLPKEIFEKIVSKDRSMSQQASIQAEIFQLEKEIETFLNLKFKRKFELEIQLKEIEEFLK